MKPKIRLGIQVLFCLTVSSASVLSQDITYDIETHQYTSKLAYVKPGTDLTVRLISVNDILGYSYNVKAQLQSPTGGDVSSLIASLYGGAQQLNGTTKDVDPCKAPAGILATNLQEISGFLKSNADLTRIIRERSTKLGFCSLHWT